MSDAGTMYANAKALHELLQESRAENEKLREEYQHIGLIAYELGRKSLAQENDKLRELVRNLYACINHRDCDDCEYADAPCDFEGEMRELGVEV